MPVSYTHLTFYDFFKEPKFSKIMELLKVMDQIAESHKKPVAQVAVNWSTQKDYVGTALDVYKRQVPFMSVMTNEANLINRIGITTVPISPFAVAERARCV